MSTRKVFSRRNEKGQFVIIIIKIVNIYYLIGIHKRREAKRNEKTID